MYKTFHIEFFHIVFSVSLLIVPFKSHAGGMEIPDLGTVAIGRGAAFTARADNLSAFYYNPAGLTKSKGQSLLLGVNIANVSIDYLRLGEKNPVEISDGTFVYNPGKDYYWFYDDQHLTSADYVTESNQNPVGPIPMLIYNWGNAFNVEGLALSAGLITPSSFGMPKYTDGGAQRYIVQEANQLILYPGIGVAYSFNRYFQIGATFLWGIADITMTRAVRLESHVALSEEYLGEGETYEDIESTFNEDWAKDIGFKIKARDIFMPTATFGVMSNPLDWLELGATVRLPVIMKASGKVTEFRAPDEAPNLMLKNGQDNFSLNLLLPLTVRLGARYIHRYFDVEVNFVWENWSALQSVDLKTDAVAYNPDRDQTIEFPKSSEIPLNFKDTYSVRVGGDIDVWPEHVAVRLGGYFQSSAYPDNYDTFSLFAPWGEQYGVGGGVSWRVATYLDVHIAYLRVIQRTVILRRGIVQQMAPVALDENGNDIQVGNIVNSGKYMVGANIFGLSVEGHF